MRIRTYEKFEWMLSVILRQVLIKRSDTVMKLINFKLNEEIHLGIKVESGIIDVTSSVEDTLFAAPTTMEQVIASGQAGLSQLTELIKQKGRIISEEHLIYAPCLAKPEKILCVGLNYVSHATESKIDIPVEPILFSKFNNALAAHRQIINLPKTAQKFDYEAELVMVIGKEASNVSKEEALSYVFGYTTGNDLSARDLQFRSGQWLIGKTCDHFAPIGPYLVTADGLNPNNLDITCEINGRMSQTANTRDMIFDCATIISYASQYMTLKPGDIIFTGTPSGVILGYPEADQKWLKAGDEIKVSIEGIGTLQNVLG